MASSLATALAAAPHGPDGVSDVIWRNTDLTATDWIGACPTDGLLDELLATVGAGEAGQALGRLVPSRRLFQRMLATGPVPVLCGAVTNPHCTDADLAALAASSQTRVAQAAAGEQRERGRLRSELAGGGHDALVGIVRSNRLELLAEILDQQPETVARISPGDQGELLVRLEALDPDLGERLAVTILGCDKAPVTATLARWALGNVVGETLLGLIDAPLLQRRVTDVAAEVLQGAGLLRRPASPARPRSASIDGMALVLTPGELGALYVNSSETVSPATEQLIVDQCPAGLLASYLAGGTPRRPEPDQVRRIILGASPDRRSELCSALTATVKDPERVLTLPWAGELALGLTTTGLRKLGLLVAGSLRETLDGLLGGRAEAWEFLLVLSEEWERTLADLAVAAGIIEDVTV